MKTIIAGALGECVHVAGISHVLRLAEAAGWRAVFLGPAVSIENFIAAIQRERADPANDQILVGVSYRLTPETGERLLGQFAEAASEFHAAGVRFVFGGTPPVAARAAAIGFFERTFDGSAPPEALIAYLKGQTEAPQNETDFPQTTIARIAWKAPYPLLRHHFGLPTMADSLRDIEHIAESQVLDVISLGIDQDAQENFFHPERQDPRRTGAGGVPVRSADDYRALYAASRRGNFPLLRTYSGTDDFIRLAELYIETINIAWCAIPLFWFNQMDGRGPWDLAGSIGEHQQVMAFYGARGIPVELNEPHHWGMRDAPDGVSVVSAYLAAYNARAFGVRDYIAQLMFNSPAGLSDAMDLAKMLAILELIAPLSLIPDSLSGIRNQESGGKGGFRIWKQTRTGLLSYPLDRDAARAHLAASVYVQMALKPHIIHVVGYTEADHAANGAEVIESCKLARRAIENALQGQPDLTADPAVQARKAQLVAEAQVTLDAIRSLAGPGVADPFTDPGTLAKAVTRGILDAPQLGNNPFGRGAVKTRIVNGGCVAVDDTGQPIPEEERIKKALARK
jgi:hypothetical protein